MNEKRNERPFPEKAEDFGIISETGMILIEKEERSRFDDGNETDDP